MGESPGDTSLSPCSVLSPSPCRSMSAQLILSPHRHVQVTTGRSFLKHYRSVTQTKQPAAGPCSHKTTSFTFTRQDQSLHAHKSMTYILIPYACVCVCVCARMGLSSAINILWLILWPEAVCQSFAGHQSAVSLDPGREVRSPPEETLLIYQQQTQGWRRRPCSVLYKWRDTLLSLSGRRENSSSLKNLNFSSFEIMKNKETFK